VSVDTQGNDLEGKNEFQREDNPLTFVSAETQKSLTNVSTTGKLWVVDGKKKKFLSSLRYSLVPPVMVPSA